MAKLGLKLRSLAPIPVLVSHCFCLSILRTPPAPSSLEAPRFHSTPSLFSGNPQLQTGGVHPSSSDSIRAANVLRFLEWAVPPSGLPNECRGGPPTHTPRPGKELQGLWGISTSSYLRRVPSPPLPLGAWASLPQGFSSWRDLTAEASQSVRCLCQQLLVCEALSDGPP